MILYFDSYITDIPLSGKSHSGNDNVRSSCSNYAMPSKVDIAKYTLASYAQYNWEHVLIKYEVDDDNDYKILDEYILNLFPAAIIVHKRGDSFAEFQKSLKIINSFADNWIFYTGDNDQPWIGASNDYVDDLISIASNYESKYEYISIKFTHFSESLSICSKDSPINLLYGRDIKYIEDNSKAKVILRKQGDNTSTQIVNKSLLNYWFSSVNYPDKRIIRSEDIRYLYLTTNQLVIIPKKEICAHFDGFPHTIGTNHEIADYQIPPLLIPKGFFEEKIKLRYGFEDYKDGWLNINPIIKKYIFEGINGVDLKIEKANFPTFWSNKISRLEINNNVDPNILKKAIEKNTQVMLFPWRIKNKKIKVNTIIYVFRYIVLYIWVRSQLYRLTHVDNERRNFIKKLISLLKYYKKQFIKK
jgi:hypothetical protein